MKSSIEALYLGLNKFSENAPKPREEKFSSQARFSHVFLAPAIKAIYTHTDTGVITSCISYHVIICGSSSVQSVLA